mgnify:FL=1
MANSPSRARTAPEHSAAAVRYLAEHGYDTTTAGDLADTVGISRSTFFRRYGNKDDVIFADHVHALAQLEEFLGLTDLTAPDALVDGTCDVLRLLIRNPDSARLRFELMRHTPALRDRELIITHRYERVFARYIREVMPAGSAQWVPASLSAGLVAVHNATLRDWLRGGSADAVHVLNRDLRQLVSLYQPWLAPESEPASRRVVVAVYDAAASPEAVLQSIAATLPAH